MPPVHPPELPAALLPGLVERTVHDRAADCREPPRGRRRGPREAMLPLRACLAGDRWHEDLVRRQTPYRNHPDLTRDRRFADSPLEEDGFEPSVPPDR